MTPFLFQTDIDNDDIGDAYDFIVSSTIASSGIGGGIISLFKILVCVKFHPTLLQVKRTRKITLRKLFHEHNTHLNTYWIKD